MIKEGTARIFGDNINGDTACQFSPETKGKLDPEFLAPRCMMGYDPNFTQRAKAGDMIIAGKNFGSGHVHPEFYYSLTAFGIGAVIADSVSDIFLREAVNAGIPVLECEGIKSIIAEGDRVQIDLSSGIIKNLTNGKQLSGPPLPPELIELISAGGIIPYLKSQKKKGLL
jgi:3-isopropylmalate/(R)-2-methylmalate dehydratase small subunit